MDHVAAVSCGLYAGQEVLDLDYVEDSAAGTDSNFVLTGRGRLIEVQMSAEGSTFSRAEMINLLDLAEMGVAQLVAAQSAALGGK
jgi:ribonuclease PH